MIAFLISTHVYGQDITFKGDVKTKEEGRAIPYTSIGVKGKAFGTIADSLGKFVLLADKSAIKDTDTIIFSRVGYSSLRLSVKDAVGKKLNISLAASPATQLDEVVINETKDKIKVYGRTPGKMTLNPRAYSSYPRISDISGREQATILNIDNDIQLKEVNFLLIRNNFTNVMFRLNIYTVNDNLPDELISTKEILYETKDPRGWKTINLDNYNIRIKGHKKIAIALQLVKSGLADRDTLKHSYLIPSFPSPLKKSYFREKSESEWMQVKSSYLYVNIKAYKLSGNHNDLAQSEAPDSSSSQEYMKLMIGNNPNVGKTIPVDSAQIYYETYGDGEPLVLLHGNNESIASFRSQILPLSKRYKIIAIDTRGQGNSIDNSTAPYSYELFAKDVMQIIDQLKIEKINLLGWSDGANTALILAFSHPELIKKLAIFGANLTPGKEALTEQTLEIFKQRRDSLLHRNETKSVVYRLTDLVLNEPHIRVEDLKKITAPTLVMAGEHDVINEEHTQLISSSISDAKSHIFKGGDHYVPIKQPEAFNHIVANFMSH
ncbi:hypothetical protein GCM10023231_17160 [Olivibacter ginsenosidimutans]|uniref:AB hydrolase-1 domain-containing protein n=1 Tax=Olivibacter ginsenosidimutans TaxID=1176537 RepID=A0ABP9B2Q4_9SPHI